MLQSHCLQKKCELWKINEFRYVHTWKILPFPLALSFWNTSNLSLVSKRFLNVLPFLCCDWHLFGHAILLIIIVIIIIIIIIISLKLTLQLSFRNYIMPTSNQKATQNQLQNDIEPYNISKLILGLHWGKNITNLWPICSQCTFSLTPENIRRPYGFLFLGARERVYWEQMG